MTPLQPHFAPTVVAGEFIFVSGQLAFDESGAIEGDIEAQTRRCLDNLETLLRPHGLERVDVVKATVWLRRAEDFATFNQTYGDFFGAHRPARSTVVCDLAHPAAIVEVEAIARIRGDAA